MDRSVDELHLAIGMWLKTHFMLKRARVLFDREHTETRHRQQMGGRAAEGEHPSPDAFAPHDRASNVPLRVVIGTCALR